MEIDDKQTLILKAVSDHWKLYGQGPTHDDMSRTLNATKSMVEWHMRKLLAAGMLTRVPGRHYDLRVTETGAAAL